MRIVCKLSPFTMGGCVYQRKQYKKARYRKAESREFSKLQKSIKKMFHIDGERKDNA